MGVSILLLADYVLGILFPLVATQMLIQKRIVPSVADVVGPVVILCFLFATATWSFSFLSGTSAAGHRLLSGLGLLIQIIMAVVLMVAAPFPLR